MATLVLSSGSALTLLRDAMLNSEPQRPPHVLQQDAVASTAA